MSPEVAAAKMRACWELGLAEVTVRPDVFDAFLEYVTTTNRWDSTPMPEKPMCYFKSLKIRKAE